MSDYPQDAFTLWFNCIKDQKKPGEHWAISEIPVESLRALLEWAKTAEKVKNDREQDCAPKGILAAYKAFSIASLVLDLLLFKTFISFMDFVSFRTDTSYFCKI